MAGYYDQQVKRLTKERDAQSQCLARWQQLYAKVSSDLERYRDRVDPDHRGEAVLPFSLWMATV